MKKKVILIVGCVILAMAIIIGVLCAVNHCNPAQFLCNHNYKADYDGDGVSCINCGYHLTFDEIQNLPDDQRKLIFDQCMNNINWSDIFSEMFSN